MRKLKTIFSVLLAICLLLSSFTVAFAEETGSTESTTPATYTVTVDGGGFKFFFLDLTVAASEGQSTLIETMKVPDGSTVGDIAIINDEPLKTTENFLGWKLEGSDSAELWTLDKILEEKITSDMKFIAQWTEGFVTPFNNGYDKNVSFETGADTIGLKITANFSDTPINNTKCFIPVGTIISDSGITGVSVIDVFNADAEYTWNMYVDGSETPSIENIPHSEIPKLAITGTTVFRLNTSSGETTPPTENPDGGNQTPDTATLHEVMIEANGVGYWIENPTEDGYEIGMCGGVSAHVVESCKTLAESGINVWHEVQHYPYFLGWKMFNIIPGSDGKVTEQVAVDEVGNPVLLPTEKMLTNVFIQNDVRFVAVWEEGYDGSAEPGYESVIHLDGNYGTFDLKDTNGGFDDSGYTRFDMNLKPGMSLTEWGVLSIEDLKYWDEDRAFVGWNVYRIHDGYEEQLNENILTTKEILEYPAVSGKLTFKAVWEGDDSDYIVKIGYRAPGGTFKIAYDSTNPDEITVEREYDSFGCKKNGKTFSEQHSIAILSDPVREGYTFEGWIALPMDRNLRYTASTKLYKTEELMKLPFPEIDTEYTAKWKECPMDYYLYGDPIWEEEYETNGMSRLYVLGNGGKISYMEKSEGEVLEYGGDYYYLDAEGTKSFEESNKDWGYEIVSMSAEKDCATLENFTTYAAERIYWVVTEDGKAPVINDPTITVLYFNTYEDNVTEYLLLKNAKVYSETLTLMEAVKLSKGNYVMVANWSDWQAVEVEGSKEKYMLDVNTVDITVPKAAQDKYETVEKAKEALKEAALSVPSVNKEKSETVYYEITLKVQKADGTWETVTPENFPKEGIKVTIPYNGLDPEKLDFVVTHLISSGDKAGEIEVLKHTEGKTGLEATVYSLSPFAVTYQSKEDAVPEATATPEPTATPAPTTAPEKNPNDVPPTGDNNAPLVFLAMMTAAAAALFITIRKLRKA